MMAGTGKGGAELGCQGSISTYYLPWYLNYKFMLFELFWIAQRIMKDSCFYLALT